jgi:hypothetical protein
MSGTVHNYKKLIQQLAGTYDKDYIEFEIAQVDAVDISGSSPTQWTITCHPVSGIAQTPANGVAGPNYTDVQLSAELGSNGFILVPTVGSNVILAVTLRNEIYVFMTSEVDQLIFYRDNGGGTFHSFVINSSGITTGDGSFGGIPKLLDPSDPTAGVLARLNALESFVGTLKTAMGVWTPVAGDGGAALKAAIATWLASTTPNTTRTQLENKTFTQGKPLT